MVKKIIVLILFFLFFSITNALVFNSFCLAAGTGVNPSFADPLRGTGSATSSLGRFEEMLIKILSWLWPISLVVAVLMIIIGAYYLVLSGGDPQRAATGKKVIVYALVGVAIITLALGIWKLIKMILGI